MLGRRQAPQDPGPGELGSGTRTMGEPEQVGRGGHEHPPGWPCGYCPWAAGQAVALSPEQGVGKEVGTRVAPCP